MEKVAQCVEKVTQMFTALRKGDHAAIETLAAETSKLEYEADQIKHDIQNHLPKRLFMAIDRSRILDILGVQDNIADKAENIGVLLTLKALTMPDWLSADFDAFLNKNLESFQGAREIIDQLDELLESGFGGEEAERVLRMVERVAHTEHEVDLLQRQLLKSVFANESSLSTGDFFLWTKLFKQVSDLSNLSERLANRVRRTLELKN
jgi:predicted phosphate transport protein (TIGR00153 family)